MVLSFPIVCKPALIANVQPIFANHVLPEDCIPLCMAPQVPSTTVGIEISIEYNSALQHYPQQVQLCANLSPDYVTR